MANPFIRTVKNIAQHFGMDIVRMRTKNSETELQDTLASLQRLREMSSETADPGQLSFVEFCSRYYKLSKSQIFQDLFVCFELGEKEGGFFVEFGATNGVNLSNSYMFEKHYQWRGILAEPARVWRSDLQKNRECTLDFRCVWDEDGIELQFNEASFAELSTVDSLSKNDLHAKSRQDGERYSVNTVSLNSLLRENLAPRQIDYLSVDTEGSELRILSAFDFDRYDVKIITVEHNYTADRELIYSLLTSKGFVRKFTAFSLWDDWYVASSTR